MGRLGNIPLTSWSLTSAVNFGDLGSDSDSPSSTAGSLGPLTSYGCSAIQATGTTTVDAFSIVCSTLFFDTEASSSPLMALYPWPQV